MEVSAKQLKKDTNQSTEQDGSVPIPEVTGISSEEKALLREITEEDTLNERERIEKRKKVISENSVEPVEFAFERAIGRNDSLYSNFAELIALTKRKVCRIVTKEDGKKTSGTGFMVSNRLLLTNWHVFKNKQMADEGEAHFFYEYDVQGHPLSPVIFRFDTTGFFNDRLLDYCFVAVQPMDVTGRVSLENIGYLYLDKTLGKVVAKGVEKLNIIHHPQGDYKQISIRENTFKETGKIKIFYETDTAPGSSGSPVLNDQWQVVGLHHRSVAKMSADGKNYLDQDDNVIPVINDKIDATRIVWVKNEGIRISVILKHLSKKNPNNELVAGLAVSPPPENFSFVINDRNTSLELKNSHIMPDNSQKNININVPVHALSADHSIEISLSSKIIETGKMIATGKTQITSSSTEPSDELLLEAARITKEQAVDFDPCQGYDPNFLGVEIPLPQPKKAIKKQIARLINNENEMELKYFKYSVIFNAETHMPLISAVNVEGDAAKRLDNSKRKDDWLRDRRIAFEHQLADKYYSKSNFDRGHMSRFEDANWDITELDAHRNGVYTCFYTNACPQVAGLNGPGGLWGKLEKAVLERGIKKQGDKPEARMTVFNGPIFNKEKDRPFKGITVPMEYFKIVLWLNDDGQLKATAFKLSQETKVGNIKFDEMMRLEEEALDIDKNVVFKGYQCSIKSLSNLTNIDFKHLEQFDTLKNNNGSEENLLEHIESIVL